MTCPCGRPAKVKVRVSKVPDGNHFSFYCKEHAEQVATLEGVEIVP